MALVIGWIVDLATLWGCWRIIVLVFGILCRRDRQAVANFIDRVVHGPRHLQTRIGFWLALIPTIVLTVWLPWSAATHGGNISGPSRCFLPSHAPAPSPAAAAWGPSLAPAWAPSWAPTWAPSLAPSAAPSSAMAPAALLAPPMGPTPAAAPAAAPSPRHSRSGHPAAADLGVRCAAVSGGAPQRTRRMPHCPARYFDWALMLTLARTVGTPALIVLCLTHGFLGTFTRLVYDSEKHLTGSGQQQEPPSHGLRQYVRIGYWVAYCCCSCFIPLYYWYKGPGATVTGSSTGAGGSAGTTGKKAAGSEVEMTKVGATVAHGSTAPPPATPAAGPSTAGATPALIAGLSNPSGQNCCFVSSVVQVARVFPTFRAAVQAAWDNKEHPVMLALHDALAALENEDGKPGKQSVTPAALRRALAAYRPDKFEAGRMGDAAEFLRSVLKLLEDGPGGPALVDSEFRLRCRTVFGCQCKVVRATLLPSAAEDCHLLYARQLCEAVQRPPTCMDGWLRWFGADLPQTTAPLGDLLKVTTELGTARSCQFCCTKGCAKLIIEHAPVSFLTLEVTYERNDDDDVINGVYRALQEELDLRRIDPEHASRSYILAGMVTLGGHHHVAYVLHGGQWIRADDETVRVVGDLAAVRDTGIKGKEMPVLAFFRAPAASAT
ncbi:probable inactive ubiquitin carboxyl-terminal hydrolase 54 at C-terminar half [Coccomyxa sp. Obi]|nr:probable inactive ubiquitin carboxyl-terminal hydrolase 54 at C-terminar half [Coccomyxa sp. Obi]